MLECFTAGIVSGVLAFGLCAKWAMVYGARHYVEDLFRND